VAGVGLEPTPLSESGRGVPPRHTAPVGSHLVIMSAVQH